MAAPADTIKAFYGLSRGTQATLSLAQPLLGALIADDTPPAGRLMLCLLAAAAGYFAVFAVNDLLDAPLDRRRLKIAGEYEGFDIDGAGARHPLATGQLKVTAACAWIGILSTTALILVAYLNPVCAALFVIGALLEIGYCALATITSYKCIVSGIMVAVGASIGWFALRSTIDWPLLSLFAIWIACWEIGGRNIPNDWVDVEEDVHLDIKTVPVVFGYRTSAYLILGLLFAAYVASIGMMILAWPSFGPIGLAGACSAGGYFLLMPSFRLLRDPSSSRALVLFNDASLYPVVILVFVVLSLTLRPFGI